MISASIITSTRVLNVNCDNNKEKAIEALQNSVNCLNKEDGRCKFVVYQDGVELYSWFYQPTIREEKMKQKKIRPISPYRLSLIIYLILNGKELNYNNLYHDGEMFDSVAEARLLMKDKGYGRDDYHIVYEYIVDNRNHDCIYGTGLGYTKAEAKEQLNRNLEYYNIIVKPNGTIIDNG